MAEVAASGRRNIILGVGFAVIAALGLGSFLVISSGPAVPDAPVIAVPSGQPIYYIDTISNIPGQNGLTYRFRFVAPEIAPGGSMTSEASQDDLLALCETFALPRLPETGPRPNQVVISLSDQETPFGEVAPDVTQFFEAYAVTETGCEWQLF